MAEAAGIYRNELQVDGNFTTVDNDWIRSSGLSVGANFLWVYLISHRIGYELRDSQILRETGFGRKGLRAARKELVEKGWLVLQRTKNPDGSLGTYSYHLQDPRDPSGTVAAGTVEQGTVAQGPDIRKPSSKKTIQEKNNEGDIAFSQFWSEYPRKKDKGHARRAFEKALEKTDLETILNAVRLYKEQESDNDIEFIAYPATWLNGERWEDDYDIQPLRETPGPGTREWVKVLHEEGEHFACEPGEFDCK
jgi:hypothetical protein